MKDNGPAQPSHPLPQAGGFFVIEAGELRPEGKAAAAIQDTAAKLTLKPAVKPAVKEA